MTTDTRDPDLARYDVVLTRLYDAAREDVFDAWSSEERLVRWFGPDLYPAVSFELDFRPGGAFELCMRGPNGEEARSKGEYVEIAPPERIVMTSRIEHEGAGAVRGAANGDVRLHRGANRAHGRASRPAERRLSRGGRSAGGVGADAGATRRIPRCQPRAGGLTRRPSGTAFARRDVHG